MRPLSFFVVFTLLGMSAFADVLRVPQDYPTIQAAIMAAKPGDTVAVSPGTYHEDIALPDDNVTVVSTDGPEVTIIQGTGTKNTVDCEDLFSGPERAVLDGFTITGGVGFLDVFTRLGGAIFCDYSNDPLIRRCIITGNTAAGGYGGAVCAVNFAYPTLESCLVVGNSAMFGGGLAALNHGTVFAVNTTVTGNVTTHGGRGGGAAAGLLGGIHLGNSIVWGNTLPSFYVEAMAVLDARYTDVEGGWSGPGNIDADPMFVNGHHLAATSPCVDQGEPGVPPSPGAEWDLERNSRTLDANFDGTFVSDMGAYELTNLRLSVTGNFKPGGVITIATDGTPNLLTILLVGFRKGTELVSPLGYLGFDVTAAFGFLRWPSAPSSVDVALPPTLPPGLLLVFQGLAWEATGRGNTSNPVYVVLE